MFRTVEDKEEKRVKTVSQRDARQIAVDCVKRKRNQDKINVSYVEQKGNDWIVQGTCPLDLEGHPWTERFEVVVDRKGKVTSIDFMLL